MGVGLELLLSDDKQGQEFVATQEELFSAKPLEAGNYVHINLRNL